MLIKTGDDISPETNYKARQLHFAIQSLEAGGITEIVPAYNEVMIYYDPVVISYKEVSSIIHQASENLSAVSLPAASRIQIPVCYDEEYSPDLPCVASSVKLSADEVVQIHTGNDYLVYMLGFAPGFPYLGGMDKRIACARKETPRIRVPAGSVGIAGEQTGIYSLDSPGGWQIIGWTPVPLFTITEKDPFLLRQGDKIRFFAVGKEEALAIQEEVGNGKYMPKKQIIKQ